MGSVFAVLASSFGLAASFVAEADREEPAAVLADLRANSLGAEEIRGAVLLPSVRIVGLDALSGTDLQKVEKTQRGAEDKLAEIRTAIDANETFEAAPGSGRAAIPHRYGWPGAEPPPLPSTHASRPRSRTVFAHVETGKGTTMIRQQRQSTPRDGGLAGYMTAALGVLLFLANVTAGSPALAQTESVATGPLDTLRQEALLRVNDARRQQGLQLLELTDPLNAAAQAHAEDMAKRDYYSHVSPEGEDVQNRYIENGGSRWRFVAENIATCEGCAVPPDTARVRSFHEGWMQSPEHRQNILARGLEGFGFGIAALGGRIYAVQTFAGPGSQPRLQPGQEVVPLSPEERLEEAVVAVNRARQEEALPPLEASDALTTVADRLLAGGSGENPVNRSADLFKLLAGERADWRRLAVVSAACGGCGSAPVAADIGYFTDQWLSNSQHRQTLLSREATHLGFAMNASGDGRKAAATVIGQHR